MSGTPRPTVGADSTTATPGADRHTDPVAPAPAPAAVVSHETDEDVAKRLSHELNVTGRARRAPAPSYVPAPIKQGLDPERLKLLRKRQSAGSSLTNSSIFMA